MRSFETQLDIHVNSEGEDDSDNDAPKNPSQNGHAIFENVGDALYA